MDKEKLTALIKKYLEGNATAAEKHFVEVYYKELHSGKSIESVLSNMEIDELEVEMFRNIRSTITESPVKQISIYKRYRSYAAIAASILILFSVGLALYLYTGKNDAYQVVYAKAGNVLKLELSDGTFVWLNSKSRLTYPESFKDKSSREIYLEGEAYFEVKHDKAHPFLVHTQTLTTRVLGTRFNVKAYSNIKTIEVTLLEGKVMLTTEAKVTRGMNKNPDTLFLKPNEKALYRLDVPYKNQLITQNNFKLNAGGKLGVVIKDKPENITALSKHTVADATVSASWKNGELVFDNEPLQNVLASLSRKYDVVVKAAPDLLDYPISAKFGNQSIDDILLNITNQIKRKAVNSTNVKTEMNVQYKKSGSDYYIE